MRQELFMGKHPAERTWQPRARRGSWWWCRRAEVS